MWERQGEERAQSPTPSPPTPVHQSRLDHFCDSLPCDKMRQKAIEEWHQLLTEPGHQAACSLATDQSVLFQHLGGRSALSHGGWAVVCCE